MENILSIKTLLNGNDDLHERLLKAKVEIDGYTKSIKEVADKTSLTYDAEIKEGTRKRQLLLEAGRERGKSEEEVLSEYGKYIPTVRTPILNLLYFMMRDGEKTDWLSIHKKINESQNNPSKELNEVMSNEELDRICERLVHEDEEYNNVEEPEDMDRFIYGNMSHAMFVRIKKLKALSTSDNQHEAFLSFQLCNKLCKKYGLDFNKIPCNID